MDTLVPGENKLINYTLLQSDGSNLNIAGLSTASAVLFQKGSVVKTYVLGTDPELREGASANILQLEITESISLNLSPGKLLIKYTIKVPDASFAVDTIQVDIPSLEIKILDLQ